MSKIRNIEAREILDSRGNPTIAVELTLDDNSIGEAFVPSGASTGIHEALELRDGDMSRYGGKGVLKAVENVNTAIKDLILNNDIKDQRELDNRLLELDGTENKSKLGANAILGVSLAYSRATAESQGLELYEYIQKLSGSKKLSLPQPMMNIINGGQHADNKVDIQEFMIVPLVDTFREKIRVGAEVFHTLKGILKEKGLATSVGDEGGFAPDLGSDEEALELIVEAIKKAGYKPGDDVSIAIDAAASSFYDEKKNNYKFQSDGKDLSVEDLIEVYKSWVDRYPIISIEDPLFEDAWEDWQKFMDVLGDKIQVVGDDHYVTNIKRLKKGIEMKTANAILIKLNQIGTLSETLDAITMAKENNFATVISHRSGETRDTFISDLAVGVDAGQIKTGSMSRSERVAKYNRLMKIEKLIS